MNKVGYLFILLCISGVLKAQNTRTDKRSSPYTYSEFDKKEKKGFLFFKKKEKPIAFYSYEEEVLAFRKRMKKAQKQHAKEEKMAERPEYADPAFFGHKRIPKRRKPGKQKFCKKCGIKH